MAIKRVNPTSAGRRFQTYPGFDEITKTTPEKSLIKMLKKSGGRNNLGRITTRWRGGGQKLRTLRNGHVLHQGGCVRGVYRVSLDERQSGHGALGRPA